MRIACAFFLLFGLIAGTVVEGAIHRTENFVVMCKDEVLAAQVAARAEYYRKRAAEEWLGKQLPSGVGRAIIHVAVTEAEDSGFTWPIDKKNPRSKFHGVWLRTTPEGALGARLGHEIVHVILATGFSERPLPAWADEGAASLEDDPQRVAIRQQIIHWYAQTGNWPDLKAVLVAPSIKTSNQAIYSVSASLTEYLLTRGDKAKFLRFASEGNEKSWDEALREHYGLHTVAQLQAAWQAWVGRTLETRTPVAVAASRRRSP